MASTPVPSGSEPISLDSRRKQVESEVESARPRNALALGFLCLELVIAAALIAGEVPHLSGPLVVLGVLIALSILSESAPIQLYSQKDYVTPGFVFITAIMVLFGPAGVLIAAPIEAAGALAAKDRKADLWLPHNATMFAIVYALAAHVYGLMSPIPPTGFEPMMVPAVLVASMAAITGNILLLGAFGSLYRGRSLAGEWTRHNWLIPHYVAFGLIGLALALATVALGVAGIFVFLAPVLVLRLAMKQYIDKTKDNVEKLEVQNQQLRVANIEISRVKDELQVSYDGTLEALVNALDARDQETKGHSLRVQRYMMDIAREFGVQEGTQEWLDMLRGSLLHDVGKIGVSDTVLLKPGKLTEAEWASMRQHPEIGFNMLHQVNFLKGAAEIILSHHERWDGNGYPRGLHEDEIPLGARIFMVCDTFDSMTSDRPYRAALSTQEALDEILKHQGAQFDPRVVEAFLDVYEKWVREREYLHQENSTESILRVA